MTAQLSLDDYAPGQRPPRARREDHTSSHDAADRLESSGRADAQMQATLAAVLDDPGCSSADLAERSYIRHGHAGPFAAWRYQLARRLPELEDAGLVIATKPERRPLRWWPAGYELPGDAGEVRRR